jgi:hypothetical protein
MFKEEFVTCGGIRLGEVDFKTMESRICPGCYLAGEVLDVDGITGGFNFQNAWTTGWLAGRAMPSRPAPTPGSGSTALQRAKLPDPIKLRILPGIGKVADVALISGGPPGGWPPSGFPGQGRL